MALYKFCIVLYCIVTLPNVHPFERKKFTDTRSVRRHDPVVFCLQVGFSDPLSFLQRLTEDLEYADCLDCRAVSRGAVISRSVRRHGPVVACLQVGFSEPLSFLQRLTEDLEYADCLDAAAALDGDDSCLRLAYVLAFAVSGYASTTDRLARPFNPLLGETFDCDRTADLGWRSIAEKVRLRVIISTLSYASC